jgi:hypothetical protein
MLMYVKRGICRSNTWQRWGVGGISILVLVRSGAARLSLALHQHLMRNTDAKLGAVVALAVIFHLSGPLHCSGVSSTSHDFLQLKRG